MKLYVATLIERRFDDLTFIQHFTSKSAEGLAVKVDDALCVEERERGIEIPRDFCDILIECENGNTDNEPLSIGEDADLSSEYLLATSIEDV